MEKRESIRKQRVCHRGNVLHEKIEHYLDNEWTPETGEKVDDLTLELFNQLRPELDKIDNILALEAPLWSETTMLQVVGLHQNTMVSYPSLTSRVAHQRRVVINVLVASYKQQHMLSLSRSEQGHQLITLQFL